MSSVIYRPSSGVGYDFELKHTPIATKSDWGIDTLTAEFSGALPGLVAFVAALEQGQTTTYNGQTFYLQSWSDDKDTTYPTVTLTYKGLFAGIPLPLVSGQTIVQSGTISCTRRLSPRGHLAITRDRQQRVIFPQADQRYRLIQRQTSYTLP